MKWLCAFLGLMLALDLRAQSEIREIRIKSAEGAGLGPVHEAKLMLNGRKLNPAQAKALAHAMAAPTFPEPTPESLGITDKWLQSTVDRAVFLNSIQGSRTIPPDRFRNLWLDSTAVRLALPTIFSRVVMDSLRMIEVTVEFEDGVVWTASTDSENPWMLPWRIRTSGTVSPTFNADVSRAVAALMPARMTSRTALMGNEIFDDLLRALSRRSVVP